MYETTITQATIMEKGYVQILSLLAVLVFTGLGDVEAQSNDTLTQEIRLNYYGYYYGYPQVYDSAYGYMDVCWDDFWNNDRYDFSDQLCDPYGYNYGYTNTDYDNTATRVKYNVVCDDNEKVGECTPTELYYTTCEYQVWIHCYGEKPFYQTNPGAVAGISLAVGAVVIGAIAFAVVRTNSYKKQQKQTHAQQKQVDPNAKELVY